MATLWPWLVVAGVGALHGLNPATGWAFAAACGIRSHDRTQVLRALTPIAAGHAMSVALVAAAVALGATADSVRQQVLAGALLLAGAILYFARGSHASVRARCGRTGLAVWSFVSSTVHGAGLMLVPALIPICFADSPAREITASGSLTLAVAAVAVHMAAMLSVTGMVAGGVCRIAAAWFALGSRTVLATRAGRGPTTTQGATRSARWVRNSGTRVSG